jgi:two-component sensor histidine kinase
MHKVEKTSTEAHQTIRRLQICLALENDPYKASEVIACLLHSMKAFVADHEKADLELVLNELLLNAIEHGNLGISGEEKRRALLEDRFGMLVQARRADPQLGQRSVTVAITLDPRAGEFRCRIRDEGGGFRWQALPREIKPEDFVLPHGRGILLSRLMVDQLIYNDAGNEVIVVKRIPAKSEST